MFDRYHTILKIVCLALAGGLVLQITRLAGRTDPLEGLSLEAGSSSRNTDAPRNLSSSLELGASRAPSPVSSTNLPPAARARVDRITQSEILGAVVRPQPMALLGIGGSDAFVRTPGGQTVLLREGEESGGVKLLRLGTNRVLVEHDGKTNELTLFSGLGSDTLLLK